MYQTSSLLYFLCIKLAFSSVSNQFDNDQNTSLILGKCWLDKGVRKLWFDTDENASLMLGKYWFDKDVRKHWFDMLLFKMLV